MRFRSEVTNSHILLQQKSHVDGFSLCSNGFSDFCAAISYNHPPCPSVQVTGCVLVSHWPGQSFSFSSQASCRSSPCSCPPGVFHLDLDVTRHWLHHSTMPHMRCALLLGQALHVSCSLFLELSGGPLAPTSLFCTLPATIFCRALQRYLSSQPHHRRGLPWQVRLSFYANHCCRNFSTATLQNRTNEQNI